MTTLARISFLRASTHGNFSFTRGKILAAITALSRKFQRKFTDMKTPISITGCFVAALLLAAPRTVQTQAPPPPNSIRMTVGLVVLHATTENKKGVSVSGLDKNNFEVFEDGVAQRIETFRPRGRSRDRRPRRGRQRQHAVPNTIRMCFPPRKLLRKPVTPATKMFVVNFNERVSPSAFPMMCASPASTPYCNKRSRKARYPAKPRSTTQCPLRSTN